MREDLAARRKGRKRSRSSSRGAVGSVGVDDSSARRRRLSSQSRPECHPAGAAAATTAEDDPSAPPASRRRRSSWRLRSALRREKREKKAAKMAKRKKKVDLPFLTEEALSSDNSRVKAMPTTAAAAVPATTTTTTTTAAINTRENVVAVDCEMVGVGWKMLSALARVSIVDVNGDILLDTYVVPSTGVGSITDYRTRYSGIRPRHMKDALPYAQAVARAQSLLRGRLVVGHALSNDFDVLGFRLPERNVRDTSCYPYLFTMAQEASANNNSNSNSNNNNSNNNNSNKKKNCPKLTRGLKSLAFYVLGRQIQSRARGHDSVEDAKAALDLYLSVREKWESELRNADVSTGENRIPTTPLLREEEENESCGGRSGGSGGSGGREGGSFDGGGGAHCGASNQIRGTVANARGVGNNVRSASFNCRKAMQSSLPTQSMLPTQSTLPAKSMRSRALTETSEEMAEFVQDHYWEDFPEDAF